LDITTKNVRGFCLERPSHGNQKKENQAFHIQTVLRKRGYRLTNLRHDCSNLRGNRSLTYPNESTMPLEGFSQASHRDIQLLSVLGNGAAGNGIALVFQQLSKRVICHGLAAVFL